MDFKEKPASKRVRILLLVLLWIPGVLFLWGMWIMSPWLAVPLALAGMWGTWDYLNRGDFFSDVERFGRQGEFLPQALNKDAGKHRHIK